MLCGLGASTFLSFNNTWRKPVVGAGGAVVRATLRCQVSVRIMPAGFLCPTKPPKLALHGSISPCLDISVLYSIILQTLNSCAIRPPDSTACPHHRLTPLTLRYNVPDGMQCVLKKIMNCHEVPYSLITKKSRHIHNLSSHGLVADFIIF